MAETRSLDDLLQAARAFQESRVLLTALELGVFGAVQEASKASDIALRIQADPRATEMLLNALTALGAMEKRDGLFHCTQTSQALGSARAGLMHTVNLWDNWSTLTSCVRQGTSVIAQGADMPRSPEQTEHFIGAMHARASAAALGLVQAVGAESVSRMLDVGGGPATFAITFAQANPLLHAEVLDLETVIPIARRHIHEAGLEERVSARSGDLRQDELGDGYDLVLVSAICHMLDEDENRDLLRRCARAMVPGGRIVIRDFILEPDRTAPRHAALFALNMLVATRGGNTYTEAEYRAWLKGSGFVDVQRLASEEDVLVARRP